MLVAENGEIFFTKMMAIFMGMLHHGRFVIAKSVFSGGGVLFKTSCSCTFCFADVCACADFVVTACTAQMVEDAGEVLFVKFVLGLD